MYFRLLLFKVLRKPYPGYFSELPNDFFFFHWKKKTKSTTNTHTSYKSQTYTGLTNTNLCLTDCYMNVATHESDFN